MKVYLITCSVNNKYYVGQHSGDNLQDYLRCKLNAPNCKNKKNSKSHLFSAIKKYGRDKFFIEQLSEVNSKEKLDDSEKAWIVALDATNHSVGMNITFGGEGHLGHKPSQETRDKLSKAKRGKKVSRETCLKISKALIGKKLSEEHKANISKAKKGEHKSEEFKEMVRRTSTGRKHSKETKEKLRVLRRGEGSTNHKLTNSDVIEIKKRLKLGEKTKILGEEFKISQAAICAIKSGRIWRHINVQ
jgi:group I intron endonuclease